MIEFSSNNCCVCLEDVEISYKCNTCQSAQICRNCQVSMMESGLANKCPCCNKKIPWCVEIKINEEKFQYLSYLNIENCLCGCTSLIIFAIIGLITRFLKNDFINLNNDWKIIILEVIITILLGLLICITIMLGIFLLVFACAILNRNRNTSMIT